MGFFGIVFFGSCFFSPPAKMKWEKMNRFGVFCFLFGLFCFYFYYCYFLLIWGGLFFGFFLFYVVNFFFTWTSFNIILFRRGKANPGTAGQAKGTVKHYNQMSIFIRI